MLWEKRQTALLADRIVAWLHRNATLRMTQKMCSGSASGGRLAPGVIALLASALLIAHSKPSRATRWWKIVANALPWQSVRLLLRGRKPFNGERHADAGTIPVIIAGTRLRHLTATGTRRQSLCLNKWQNKLQMRLMCWVFNPVSFANDVYRCTTFKNRTVRLFNTCSNCLTIHELYGCQPQQDTGALLFSNVAAIFLVWFA